jgi:hypothetical protein
VKRSRVRQYLRQYLQGDLRAARALEEMELNARMKSSNREDQESVNEQLRRVRR